MPVVRDAPPRPAEATGFLTERERHTTDSLTKLLAAFVAAGLGVGTPLTVIATALGQSSPAVLGFRFSAVVALVTAPLWVAAAVRYRPYRPVLAAVLACIPFGYLLALTSADDHAISHTGTVTAAIELLAMVAAAGAVLWARAQLGVRAVLMLYASGDLLTSVSQLGTTANDWKFVLSSPISLFLLGLVCTRPRRPLLECTVLLSLAAISAVNDSRSHMAFCAIVVGVIAWQSIGPRLQGASGKLVQALALATIGAGAYLLGSSLLTSGRLGAAVQARTLAQIDNSGSLIGGGRPEWFATFELVAAQPWGFGMGVIPNTRDIALGISGLQGAKVYGASDYAVKYMFAGQFRLHAITADLWSRWGVLGVVLAVLVLGLVVSAVLGLLQAHAADAALLFVALNALWNMGFSPIYSNLPQIGLALGLLIPFVAGSSGRARRRPVDGVATGLLQPRYARMFDGHATPGGGPR